MSKFFLALTILILASPALAAAPDPGPEMGTNLTFLNPTSGEWPFVNAFKTSLPWVPAQLTGCFGCPEAGTLDLDDDGYIRSLDASVQNGGQVAHTFMFQNVEDHYPGGTYHVLYDGSGTLEYEGSASLNVAASVPGHHVVEVDPSTEEAFVMTLTATDPNDYIKDIRVLMPGGVCSDNGFQDCGDDTDCGGTCDLFVDNYTTQIFHPTFLGNTQPFEVLRFMDWMETVEGGLVHYSDYPTFTSARWNLAPAVVMAELGNTLRADIWINIPHAATDAFVDSLATDLAANLDPPLKVYVEYSNEVWNPSFPVFHDVQTLGCDTYSDLTNCDQDEDSGNGEYCEGHPWSTWNNDCETARRRMTSDRSRDIWARFVSAFDALPGPGIDRVARVLASQAGNTDLHDALLSHQNTYQEVDALATGGYFGFMLGGDPQVAGWNLNQLFQALEQQSIPDILGDMSWEGQFLANSSNYSSIPRVFYEGGQGLVAWGANEGNSDVTDLFDAANRDPRMADLYEDLLNGWLQLGDGRLFNHYTNCQAYRPWNRYGALEYQDQPHSESVKYQALVDFIDTLP